MDLCVNSVNSLLTIHSHVGTVAKCCVFIVQTKCEKLFMAVEKRIESHYRWCIEKLVAEEVVAQLNVFTSYSYPLKSIQYKQLIHNTNIQAHTHTHTYTHVYIVQFPSICMCMCVYVRMGFSMEIWRNCIEEHEMETEIRRE